LGGRLTGGANELGEGRRVILCLEGGGDAWTLSSGADSIVMGKGSHKVLRFKGE